MRFFVAPQTVPLATRVIGDGAQQAVLIHDWGMTGHSWDELLSRWRPEGLTILVPDLRGCGESPRPANGYSLDLMVDDLVRFFDDHDIDDAVVIGQGMGAALAQLLAAQEPGRVSRVVLVNPGPATGVPMSPAMLTLFERAITQPDERLHLLAMGLGVQPEVPLQPGLRRLHRESGNIDDRMLSESFPAWQKAWFPEVLAKVRCPVLVLAGSHDPVVKTYVVVDEVVTPIRNARLQV
ncbi:MAG: alpha/beta hydrolase, partial [Candidatus Sericytochromatia bacterium]|nr:alpha/beta hydrolase [Candidatus Sericytochromatia bacterium]